MEPFIEAVVKQALYIENNKYFYIKFENLGLPPIEQKFELVKTATPQANTKKLF